MSRIHWSRRHHCGKHLRGCSHGAAPRSYRAGAPVSFPRRRRHGFRSGSTLNALASAGGVGCDSNRCVTGLRALPRPLQTPEQALSADPERRGCTSEVPPSLYRRFRAWYGRLSRALSGRTYRRFSGAMFRGRKALSRSACCECQGGAGRVWRASSSLLRAFDWRSSLDSPPSEPTPRVDELPDPHLLVAPSTWCVPLSDPRGI